MNITINDSTINNDVIFHGTSKTIKVVTLGRTFFGYMNSLNNGLAPLTLQDVTAEDVALLRKINDGINRFCSGGWSLKGDDFHVNLDVQLIERRLGLSGVGEAMTQYGIPFNFISFSSDKEETYFYPGRFRAFVKSL